MIANKKTLYPSEPLKIWEEAKQFRARLFSEYADARKEGRLRVFTAAGVSPCFASGFRDVMIMGFEPLLVNLGFRSDFAEGCLTAAENYGFARGMCAMSKLVWGSAIWNKFMLSDGTVLNEWPKPDFMIGTGLSSCHNKVIQFLAEWEKVPFFLLDTPKFYPHLDDKLLDYVTNQVLELIEWMKKITGRGFDDELFIEGVLYQTRSFRLWTKIMNLCQTIPTPVDEKALLSMITPNLIRPHTKETFEFYTRLLDEVQDRVARGIAAVPNEQFRVISDAVPPWPYLNLWRYLEREYGAVYVASPYSVIIAGSWRFDDKGDLEAVPTPEEINMPLNSLKEAVRALIWYKMHFASETSYTVASAEAHHEAMKAIARQWKADGGILHINRACTMMGLGGVESRNVLQEAGLRCIIMEGNSCDPRDMNLTHTREEIDTYMDFMGVRKVP